ncbi:MAG: hypothetical protein J3K34DRAFT_423281 [Monoraphidium minutum]|nr:MAG: hypothetical protein J3K34DRAFT_423281 [Monoraphidium minutum]
MALGASHASTSFASLRTGAQLRGIRAPCAPAPARCSARQRRSRPVARAADAQGDDEPCALLVEVDGALTDLAIDGHREAFNRAFKDLGLDCANWSAPLYNDLMSHSDGTGEGLVSAYYSRIGWPLTVGKGEEGVFAHKVHDLKQQHLRRMLRGGQLPLRQDVQRVLQDAVASGAAVALLAETASTPEEDVLGSCLGAIDADLAPALRIYTAGLHRPPFEEGEGDGEGGTDSVGGGGSFREAAGRVQQAAAAAFVARLNADAPDGAARVGVGASLQNPAARRVAPEWLAAVAATLGVPSARCLVVATGGSLVAAAAQAGMVAAAVPRQGAPHAAYDAAAAKFEGFGPGYATWPRLKALLGAAAARGGGRR